MSFNEFNPLFNRNRVTFQGSSIYGEDDTLGGEGIVSGIFDRFSFSAGYSGFTTDGFRKGNDQDDHIVDAFGQWELNEKTSIQAEYRYRDSERGDLQLRFFEEFRPDEEIEEEINTYRLGVRHSFSPGSILLGSFMYQDVDAGLTDLPPVPFINSIDIDTDEDAYSAEIQHIFRRAHFNLTSGAGYFSVDADDDVTTELVLPPPPFGPGVVTVLDKLDRGLDHTNLYAYADIRPGF